MDSYSKALELIYEKTELIKELDLVDEHINLSDEEAYELLMLWIQRQNALGRQLELDMLEIEIDNYQVKELVKKFKNMF